jgi:hypothetical protein
MQVAPLLIGVLIVTAATAAAQPGQPPVSGEPAAAERTTDEARGDEQAVDPAKLGVSLERIRRQLAQPDQDPQDGSLRLAFRVEVFGHAPPIDLLKDFPLTGPVPYGGPTHREVLDVLTPQEFRSPAFPISGLAMLAGQWLQDRSRRQRCEDEIAEYRRLVMAGVAVAAPRCSQ